MVDEDFRFLYEIHSNKAFWLLPKVYAIVHELESTKSSRRRWEIAQLDTKLIHCYICHIEEMNSSTVVFRSFI